MALQKYVQKTAVSCFPLSRFPEIARFGNCRETGKTLCLVPVFPADFRKAGKNGKTGMPRPRLSGIFYLLNQRLAGPRSNARHCATSPHVRTREEPYPQVSRERS